jgi:hypothetical protein
VSLAGFLSTIIGIMDAAGVPHMLTGSLAAAYYATPRATQDIDLVIDAREGQIERLVDGLMAAGLYVSREAALDAFRSQGQFNAIDPESGWKVDLIVRKDRPFSATEFSRRTSVQLLGIEVALTSVEDLIIAKLEWSQLGDSDLQRRDLFQLLDASLDSMDRTYVENWVERLGLNKSWREILARHRPGPR